MPLYNVHKKYVMHVEFNVPDATGRKAIDFSVNGNEIPTAIMKAYTQGILTPLDNGALQAISPFQIKTIYLTPHPDQK
jgi:hypothetical protein